MTDLFSNENDGLMTRDEAKRLGKLDSDEYRMACEIRTVGRMSLDQRRDYIAKVQKVRGYKEAERIKDGLVKLWKARATAHLEYDYGMDSDKAKTMAEGIGR